MFVTAADLSGVYDGVKLQESSQQAKTSRFMTKLHLSLEASRGRMIAALVTSVVLAVLSIVALVGGIALAASLGGGLTIFAGVCIALVSAVVLFQTLGSAKILISETDLCGVKSKSTQNAKNENSNGVEDTHNAGAPIVNSQQEGVLGEEEWLPFSHY